MRQHCMRRHCERWHRERWHRDDGHDVPLEAQTARQKRSSTPHIALTWLIEYHCGQQAVKHTLVSSYCGRHVKRAR